MHKNEDIWGWPGVKHKLTRVPIWIEISVDWIENNAATTRPHQRDSRITKIVWQPNHRLLAFMNFCPVFGNVA